MSKVAFTILLQPFSKANSRILSVVAGRPRSIKSAKALAYEASTLKQIPPAVRLQLSGPIKITIHIFYATNRPDLDESLLLDCLQDRFVTRRTMKAGKLESERVLVQKGVYCNDRQIKQKHIFWHLDKGNPRAEVEVELLEPEPSKK